MKFSLAKSSVNDRIFYCVIFLVFTLFFLIVLYPCVFVVSASFSSAQAIQSGRVVLFPVGWNLEGYRTVFNTRNVWIGFRNSILYTVSLTILAIAMTMTCAYCLSRTDLPGRKYFILYFTFTMFFGGGLIPTYLLMRNLGLVNNPLVMVVTGLLGIWNMIVAKTFIQNSIPGELLDAAKIDGCSDAYYYVRIVLPLSKAIIAVLALFYGVGCWNSYFGPMIYLHDSKLFPLTIYLREILMLSRIDPSTIRDPLMRIRLMEMVAGIKYALIVVTVIPVIMIYPFAQRYFVKGIMIGSIKG
jgi:multiple sugar transport system permease protein/putative aldouronate transport system permease protein